MVYFLKIKHARDFDTISHNKNTPKQCIWTTHQNLHQQELTERISTATLPSKETKTHFASQVTHANKNTLNFKHVIQNKYTLSFQFPIYLEPLANLGKPIYQVTSNDRPLVPNISGNWKMRERNIPPTQISPRTRVELIGLDGDGGKPAKIHKMGPQTTEFSRIVIPSGKLT